MKQALIIGGTTGMGKATAELLLRQGIEVIISGRKGKNMQTALNELSSLGKVRGIEIELSDMDEVTDFCERIKKTILN